MAAGSFSKPVTFQNPSTTLDAAMQPIATYTDVTQVGARVRATTGRERIEAGLEATGLGITVTVRYNPTVASVSSDGRMVFSGSTYNIDTVVPSFDNTSITFIGSPFR